MPALLEHSIETPETRVSCENCPALQRLERALERLTAEFHCEVGYWKIHGAILVAALVGWVTSLGHIPIGNRRADRHGLAQRRPSSESARAIAGY